MKINVLKWVVGLCGLALINSASQAQVVENLIAGSLKSHPSITAQASQVKASEAALESAKWQYYPTPGMELTTGRGSRSDSVIAGITDVTGTASLEQPLWTGGRLDGGVDRADAELENSLEGLKAVREKLSLDTVQAYGDWVSANLSAKAWETSMAIHQRLKASVQRRFEAGLTSKGDERLADSRLESVVADLTSTQVKEQVALMAVSQLAGSGIEEAGLSVDLNLPSLTDNLEQILAKALALSPAVGQAISQSEVAKADVALQRAARSPQVFLRAAHQFGSDKNDNIPTSHITVGVRSAFGAGLSSMTAEKASQAAYEASLANVDVQRRIITERVRSNYYIVQSFGAQIKALASTAKTTEGVFNSYNRQYLAGRKTWFDLLNSARDLVQAQLRLADAKSAHFVASWKLAILTRELNNLLAGADAMRDSSVPVKVAPLTEVVTPTPIAVSQVEAMKDTTKPASAPVKVVLMDVSPAIEVAAVVAPVEEVLANVSVPIAPLVVADEVASAQVLQPIVEKVTEVHVPVELKAIDARSSVHVYRARIL